jgi:murein DD-endopeptidase MepM/ murein hydrolase activator NlpD
MKPVSTFKATNSKQGRRAPAALQTILASLAVAGLMASYLLPGYADTFAIAAQPQLQSDVQTLATSSEAAKSTVSRDSFLVTRTTLEGYRPYVNLADTFANNPNSSVQWPFSVGVPISSWFGFRSCDGCSAYHEGLDLNPGEGTPIQAIADGVVTTVGNPSGSFGVYAVIAHEINGQQVSSLYAHMLLGSLALAVGDKVTKGQLVGQVGSTGQSTGAHLHFGIYVNGTTAIDPYAWMKEQVGS